VSELAQTINRLVTEQDSDQLRIVINEITPSIAGTHDPADAPVRAVVVKAAVSGLVDPAIEVLVNAVKDGGETANVALAILRERHAATIHYLARRSGIDYEIADAQITEGIWEAAKRYDNVVAQGRGAKFHTYAHPWMKKASRPRSDTKPGRLDKPFKFWIEEFLSENSSGEVTTDPFFIEYDLYTEEDPGRSMDIRNQLASLSEDMRRVVQLRIMESRSLPEVSKLTGLSVWQIKNLTNEAKKILREGLQDYS
jgi:RNA polymerase sigma factor (sigma-70 family)